MQQNGLEGRSLDNMYRINDIMRKLRIARFRPLDVLVIGGTGAGKSSTLNALFGRETAKVGRGCDPETSRIDSYELNDYMRFWDTPGVGDDVEKDAEYGKKLIELLYKDYHLDNMQYGLIDSVIVIVDGSNRDMGSVYKLLNQVVVPNFQKDRILIGINQADMAMKGRHWDEENERPDPVLQKFLQDKIKSIEARVKEATGVTVKSPICYSAEKNYNVEKFLDMIIDNMPKERRRLC